MKKILFKIYDKLTKNMSPWSKFYTETMTWSNSKLRDYQLYRLSQLYNIKSWEEFYNKPLTTKDDLRKFKPKLSKYKDKDLTHHYTSGSTGEPLKVYGPSFIQEIKPAVFERGWRQVGWNGRDWILRLTNGEPEWKLFDWLRNVKPMNYKNITIKKAEWIIKHKPFLIHGGSGAIRELTTFIIKMGKEDILKDISVQLMSEDTEAHTKALKPYYKAVYSGYGCHELSTISSPCSEDANFVNMETCICELINNEIVVTDLWNNITPVLRYRTKDYADSLTTDISKTPVHDILKGIRGREVGYYDGPEVKKPLGWWVLGPISHRPDIINQWKMKVLIKKKQLILYIVWKDKSQNLDWYKKFIKEEAGLDVIVIERKRMLNKHRMKLLEIIK